MVSLPPDSAKEVKRRLLFLGISPRETTAPPPPYFGKAPAIGEFTLEKLNLAIDSLKNNKTGGTDELITELFKDLNEHNRNRLLLLYNEIYHQDKIPEHFNEALVVQIYKTGKIPEHYASYRPIALLNVTYKILAKMLQDRLRQELDCRIVPFQYGYRRGKSTAEPMFIARRAQEIAERHGTQLYLLALDYSKAFDSIPHHKLTECLHRMGASEKNISLVTAIYASPNIRIKIPEGISNERRQSTGIRQGCPLSPYLYIIATSCLMLDFLKDYNKLIPDTPEGAQYPTLLFADDALLLSNKAKQMSIALELIIEHSRPYNLQLNKEKCQLLVTNDLGCNVTFPDGTEVKKHASIKYLGATFSATLDTNFIVRQKLTEAAQTLRQLVPLWKEPQISRAWKLTVFNSVIRSRIFYTLDTLELTPSHQKTLDTLYYRGIRRILEKRSTYIDRFWTNERLLNEANRLARNLRENRPKHCAFSQNYRSRRKILLAHLLRAPPSNLCRLSVLTAEDQDRIATHRKKRVGRPRYTWLQECLKDAWTGHTEEPYQPEHAIPKLKDLALRRAPPF